MSIGNGTFGLTQMISVGNQVNMIAGGTASQLKAMGGAPSLSGMSANHRSILADTVNAMKTGRIYQEIPKDADALAAEAEEKAEKDLDRRLKERLLQYLDESEAAPAPAQEPPFGEAILYYLLNRIL